MEKKKNLEKNRINPEGCKIAQKIGEKYYCGYNEMTCRCQAPEPDENFQYQCYKTRNGQ